MLMRHDFLNVCKTNYFNLQNNLHLLLHAPVYLFKKQKQRIFEKMEAELTWLPHKGYRSFKHIFWVNQ